MYKTLNTMVVLRIESNKNVSRALSSKLDELCYQLRSVCRDTFTVMVDKLDSPDLSKGALVNHCVMRVDSSSVAETTSMI